MLDFIIRLPNSKKQNGFIMLVMEKLNKSGHFIPVQSTYKTVQIANTFMKENSQLHGIPRVVISNRDVKFTYAFSKDFFEGLGTQILFIALYHHQIDGQTKRVN